MSTNHITKPLEDWQQKILTDSTGSIRFTPKNDYMFKAVCQTNTYALEGLLAALLSLRQEEILDIQILNPIQLGASVDEKDCVLDVKLKLNDSRIINIEMQVLFQEDWVERSLVYESRAVSSQLKPGESYGNLLDTIHVGILDFDVFENHRKFYSKYYLKDVDDGYIYTGKFSITVVNLKQIHRATQADINSGLRDWARLFQATTWEEMLMIAENNNSMRSFTFSLKELSDDEKIQMQCEARERYEHDKASFIQQGFRDGMKQGIQQEQQRADTEQQRADTEQQRADAERQRADAAEAELRCLRAELGKKWR